MNNGIPRATNTHTHSLWPEDHHEQALYQSVHGIPFATLLSLNRYAFDGLSQSNDGGLTETP
jgi:hypothetical protein